MQTSYKVAKLRQTQFNSILTYHSSWSHLVCSSARRRTPHFWAKLGSEIASPSRAAADRDRGPETHTQTHLFTDFKPPGQQTRTGVQRRVCALPCSCGCCVWKRRSWFRFQPCIMKAQMWWAFGSSFYGLPLLEMTGRKNKVCPSVNEEWNSNSFP